MAKINQSIVFLAQNNKSNQQQISKDLTDAGFTVLHFNQATDALIKLQTVAADILLFETTLPDYEIDRNLSINISSDFLPPIILICNNETENNDTLSKWHAQAYLSSPVNSSILLSTINNCLKQTELKSHLITTERYFEAILDHSPYAIAYTDIKLNIFKANTQFYELFGFDQDTCSLYHIFTPDSSDMLDNRNQCLSTLLQQGFVDQKITSQHKQGHTLWVNLRGKLINTTKPEPSIIWTMEEMNAHRSDQQQRLLTATVFEASSQAMVVLDHQGVLEKTNSAMQNLTEYSDHELQNLSISKLFDSSANQLTVNELITQVSNSGQWKGELTLLKKDHGAFPALITINCIKLEDNSISHFIAVIADISEHKAREQVLRHRANHDPLTGLPNRNKFFSHLNDAIASAKRHDYNVALLYLDLDGFKLINDNLGHGKGDKVLQEVADKLKQCVREVDTVARLGGDEFVIILNGTSEQHIRATAERLIKSTSIQLEESLHLSVSIGISLFPKDSIKPLQLLQYADEAMYKAKRQGKQSYCWHHSAE